MFDGVLKALGVPMRGDQQSGPYATPPGPPPPPGGFAKGGADIFVGGGFDDILPNSAMFEYVKDYARQTGRPVQYVPNNRVGQVVNAIREANGGGGPVNVIGHSYGGPDAYNATARANAMGLRVDNLITLDPVGGLINKPAGGAYPASWLNVFAHTEHPDHSDLITRVPYLAHKPSNLPVEQATRQVTLGLNHRDVESMMRQSGGRAILDNSRAIPRGDGLGAFPSAANLHDNLPMMDWIRTREAGGRR